MLGATVFGACAGNVAGALRDPFLASGRTSCTSWPTMTCTVEVGTAVSATEAPAVLIVGACCAVASPSLAMPAPSVIVGRSEGGAEEEGRLPAARVAATREAMLPEGADADATDTALSVLPVSSVEMRVAMPPVDAAADVDAVMSAWLLSRPSPLRSALVSSAWLPPACMPALRCTGAVLSPRCSANVSSAMLPCMRAPPIGFGACDRWPSEMDEDPESNAD